MAVDNAVSGGVILAATSVGLLAHAPGPFSLPMDQIAFVTLFAVLGAVARAVLDAKDARDTAIKGGVEREKLPRIDLVSLGYAILGAPFVGTLAYAAIRWMGISTDYAIATIIMGMGYMGRDGINLVISTVTALLKLRLGVKE